MLELLAHQLLHLKHIICVNFITFNLINLFNINFVSFHYHQFFQVWGAVTWKDVGTWILNSHSKLFSLEFLFNSVVYRFLKSLSEIGNLFHFYQKIFLGVVYEFSQVSNFLFHMIIGLGLKCLECNFRGFCCHNLIIASNNFILLVEIQMKLIVIALHFLNCFSQILFHLLERFHRWQRHCYFFQVLEVWFKRFRI